MSAPATINPLDIHALIVAGAQKELGALCSEWHPATVAEMLQELPQTEAWMALQTVAPELRAEIFSHFDEDYQADLTLSLNRSAAAQLLTDMAPDDRAALFKRLPEEHSARILPAMAHAEREDIRRLTSYEDGTVGAVMTSDYATLEPELTAAEAIDRLRVVAPDRETIYYAYVVDANRRLVGLVSLKDLILAPPRRRVSDILQREAILAHANEDQEEAARRLQKYDLIALPVVDAEEVLVGILTHDDAIDIIVDEQQEDLEKRVAITGSHEAGNYLKKSPWEHFRSRVFWIVALAAVGLLSGHVVQHYRHVLTAFPFLVMFLPLLAASGGNTGSQSTTLVIRALSLGEVGPRDVLRVLWKELRVSFLLGVVLGGVVFVRIALFSVNGIAPGFAVALALGLQVVSATLLGALLPLLAAKLKWDPAVVASPALTTFVDVTGLLIYFVTASWILGPLTP